MSVNRSIKNFAARIAKLHPGQQTAGKKGIVAKRTEDGRIELTSPNLVVNISDKTNIRDTISKLSKTQ
jgi:hypothetical protein